jgi:hypothetical protein
MVPPSFDGRGERKRCCTISQSGLQRNSTARKLQDVARWHRGLYCWKTPKCGAAICKVWCCNLQVEEGEKGEKGKEAGNQITNHVVAFIVSLDYLFLVYLVLSVVVVKVVIMIADGFNYIKFKRCKTVPQSQ